VRGGQDQPHRASGAGLSHAWHVLVYPAFRVYFAGSVISNLGTWLQNTAQALLAYGLTHSALAVGAVVCAQFSAVLLLGPWAGTVVARVRNLTRLLITTQLASAVAAIMLTVLQATGSLSEAWLIAGAFSLGLAYSFALPAFPVLVPALVPPNEIRASLAMNSVSYNVGRAVAPVLAVLIVTTVGYTWAFLLNGASFLILAAALSRLPEPQRIPPSAPAKVMDGFRMARKDRRILLLLMMVAAITIAADPVLVLGPAMAHRFGVSSTWAGYFLAALGAGTILGSFVPVRPAAQLRHAAYPLALLGGAIIVFALGLSLWVCLVMTFLAGIACLLAGAVTQTLLHHAARPDRAATVMAAWAVAWAGSKPLASLADGLFASFFGIRAAGILLALPALLPALVMMILPRRPGRTRGRETQMPLTIP
jgi:predicted MFS family arabinose efflux permease